MRRIERQIQKEGRLRVVSVDQLHCVFAEQRRRVTWLFQAVVVPIPINDAVLLMGEIVDLANKRAVLVIKAALAWPVFRIGMA